MVCLEWSTFDLLDNPIARKVIRILDQHRIFDGQVNRQPPSPGQFRVRQRRHNQVAGRQVVVDATT